jgi:hypothetical protein
VVRRAERHGRASGRADAACKNRYEKTFGSAGGTDARPFLLTPEPRQPKREIEATDCARTRQGPGSEEAA